jgi:carboxyl-terminal processing protease
MKRMSGLGVASLCIVVASSGAGALWGTHALTRGARLSHALRLHAEILRTIESEYVDGAAPTLLETSSIRGMLATLDPHTHLLLPGAQGRIREEQRGFYDGLGLSAQRAEGGGLRVVAVHEGTPAQVLGIRAGDVIVDVDGHDARGMLLEEARGLLRGPRGTSVRLIIVRRGYDEPLRFTVVRDAIPLRSVPYTFLVTPAIGYVRLVDFKETTACLPVDAADCSREMEGAIVGLLSQGARGIILDLRDNPGGRLEQGFAVANLFLRQGQVIGSLRGRGLKEAAVYVAQRSSRFEHLPLVILTSRHSASASEIVAGAIQDHDRGLIVGERTFGKALVQVNLPLSSGFGLVLTTARYYTPSGRSIQREYRGLALEDYVQLQDRPACGGLDASPGQLTDSGRRVFGGDGIAPDVCVETPRPARVISYLEARHAFFDFAMLYDSAGHDANGRVGVAGTRSVEHPKRVMRINRDFRADAATLARFVTFVTAHGIQVRRDDLVDDQQAIAHRIEEEILRQVFGEGEGRRRAVAWDPQVQKALEVMPEARTLVEHPRVK